MGLVRLMRAENGMEAEMVCALLRGYEVRCFAGGIDLPPGANLEDLLSAGRSLFGDQFAPQTVFVHEDDEELARQVLAAPISEDEAELGT